MVIERTLAWITHHRRTLRDDERQPAHHAPFVHRSTIIIMIRQLTRHQKLNQFPDRL
jgi:putative transposase